jgi:hypothetical protein
MIELTLATTFRQENALLNVADEELGRYIYMSMIEVILNL